MVEVENKYMARCISLARGGAGNVTPNPMVGAVIVHQGKIIGEGYHRKCGEPHAEVNAIASVKDESLLKEATMYVSLEPCSHYGKTPPCAELIIRKQIPRVVVGCLDPFSAVSGRGVRMLREAGIEVVTGVMEQDAWELKWAQSADGFMDRVRMDNSTPAVVLSSAETLRRVHRMRANVAAIMVGTQTALLDNPSLTVRHWAGKSPVRVVLDRTLRIPSGYHILDGAVRTLVFTAKEAVSRQNVEYVRIDFSQPVLPQVLHELYIRKLNSLMVEGGATLLRHFLQEDLWDRMFVETAPVFLEAGVKAPDINLTSSLSLTEVIKRQDHAISVFSRKNQ
jgi:diaminohydroxyphosphoribosylaminopyrimidine deaminase / 5-amino-6-(5-phosphoribosylamino)uracil reductase